MKMAASDDFDRLEWAKKLENELRETKNKVFSFDQKVKKLNDWLSDAQAKILKVKGELNVSEGKFRELDLMYKSLLKLREHDLKKSAREARKEVKGHGKKFLQEVASSIKIEKIRNQLKSDIAELRSDLVILEQIEKGGTRYCRGLRKG